MILQNATKTNSTIKSYRWYEMKFWKYHTLCVRQGLWYAREINKKNMDYKPIAMQHFTNNNVFTDKTIENNFLS